jgi:2-dehydropantoate 2-reductase
MLAKQRIIYFGDCKATKTTVVLYHTVVVYASIVVKGRKIMENKNPRILIFGAGVIGSLYAARFFDANMDVTMFARGSRLQELQKNGLRYNEKGNIKTLALNVIDRLADDDIYDFIFVSVRCDQMIPALTELKDNRSLNIVTLTNTVGYDDWTAIVGNRLIPGFPGAGGDIKNGVLYAQFGSKSTQGTVFGEIDGASAERIAALASIFEKASLPFTVSPNILAFHISHAAFIISNKYFYTENGMVDIKTAKSRKILRPMAIDMKQNVGKIKAVGIPLLDPKAKMVSRFPIWVIIVVFRMMLSVSFTRDVLLGDHAFSAKGETALLGEVFCVQMGCGL